MVEFAFYGDEHAPDSIGAVVPETVRMVVPNRAARELDSVVPESVRSLFREASVAEEAGALRAAGVMFRAAAEALCKDRGAVGGTLYDQIEDLANRGVQSDLVDDLHEARLLGNWSIHHGMSFSVEEVADVAELIAEATHILYVEPAKRESMRGARQQRRQAHRSGSSDLGGEAQ